MPIKYLNLEEKLHVYAIEEFIFTASPSTRDKVTASLILNI